MVTWTEGNWMVSNTNTSLWYSMFDGISWSSPARIPYGARSVKAHVTVGPQNDYYVTFACWNTTPRSGYFIRYSSGTWGEPVLFSDSRSYNSKGFFIGDEFHIFSDHPVENELMEIIARQVSLANDPTDDPFLNPLIIFPILIVVIIVSASFYLKFKHKKKQCIDSTF